MPDSLVSACNRLDGVKVLWISRYGAGGNLFLDLEAVEALTQNPTTARDEIVDLLPITFRADWGMRVRRKGDVVKVLHRTSAAPESATGHPDWFPPSDALRLVLPPDWAAVRRGHAGRGRADRRPRQMVLFGRRGGPEVLDSELARLGHLAALAASIAKARLSPSVLGVTGVDRPPRRSRSPGCWPPPAVEQRLVVRTPARRPCCRARRSPRRRTPTGTPYDGRWRVSTRC